MKSEGNENITQELIKAETDLTPGGIKAGGDTLFSSQTKRKKSVQPPSMRKH